MASNRSEICFWLLKITFIGQIFNALHSAIIHISLSQYLRSCSWFKKGNRSYHLLSGLEKKDLDYYHTYCRCRNQKLSLNIILLNYRWMTVFLFYSIIHAALRANFNGILYRQPLNDCIFDYLLIEYRLVAYMSWNKSGASEVWVRRSRKCSLCSVQSFGGLWDFQNRW